MQNRSNRLRSALVGALILVAYGVVLSAVVDSPTIVMIADIISGLAVAGIAVLMYPLFRGSMQITPSLYLVLKLIEGLLMIAGGILYLVPEYGEYRDSLYDGIHLFVFVISAAIFYILLFRSHLVPRFLSVWGLIAIAALALKTVLGLFGSSPVYLDYFLTLIIANEVFLAGWLFVKGLSIDEQEKLKSKGNHSS